MNVDPIIEPERHGLWIAVGFIVALLALVMSAVAMYRIKVVAVGTQTEVLVLNKKIEQLKADKSKAVEGAQTAAPTAPAK